MHDAYLKTILRDKQLKLDVLRMENQKHIAVFQAKEDMLVKDIDSINKQLSRAEVPNK